jgi:hypothetical protein
MTLLSYASEKGTSTYPEIEDLMRTFPWSRKTLFKWAQKLQEHNLLIYEKHATIFKFKFTLPGLPPVGLEEIIATPPSHLPLLSAIRQLPGRR